MIDETIVHKIMEIGVNYFIGIWSCIVGEKPETLRFFHRGPKIYNIYYISHKVAFDFVIIKLTNGDTFVKIKKYVPFYIMLPLWLFDEEIEDEKIKSWFERKDSTPGYEKTGWELKYNPYIVLNGEFVTE